MKAQIAAKYIQFLSNKKANKNSGFTLIELLVVIIIIGILSAIALPSFLNQAAKARASESRTNVGAMNRSQQAFYLENQKFAELATAVPTELGLGIKDSENYTYRAEKKTSLETDVINYAKSLKADLKATAGGVFKTGGATDSILCEASAAVAGDAAVPADATAPTAADKNGGCGGTDSNLAGNK